MVESNAKTPATKTTEPTTGAIKPATNKDTTKLKSNNELPPKTGDLLNHHMDSSKWNEFEFRPGDILIGTYAKSGTTWAQQIIKYSLPNVPQDQDLDTLSPWYELRIAPASATAHIPTQHHRRFLKHHLPLFNLPQSPLPCYIYIARDGRDVVWSLYNHHKNHTDNVYPMINSGEFEGNKLPIFKDEDLDIVSYFERWLMEDGYPYWKYFEAIKSWWDVRGNEKVLVCHFENMKKDLKKEVGKVWKFLGRFGEVVEGSEEEVVELVGEKASFGYMKENARKILPKADGFWEGGGNTFINKGTNGRWKGVLPERLSELYEKMAVEKLGKDCAEWLKTGVDPTGVI